MHERLCIGFFVRTVTGKPLLLLSVKSKKAHRYSASHRDRQNGPPKRPCKPLVKKTVEKL